METLELPLQLRRDRGYIYFPDAILACLSQFGLETVSVKAECYKISSKQILTMEIDSREPLPENIFASISSAGRRFIMREEQKENPARYDLPEPEFECRLSKSVMEVWGSGFFPSVFHRWAACCKKLYHHADPESGRRMLLQRIETLSPGESRIETFKLEFLTPEKFMKFSVWQEDKLVGHVVAAAKGMP